jgi:ppGpp synthetase/RelA/SpoT-type nucleotidyltranferase
MRFSAAFLNRAEQVPGEVSEEGDVERDNFRGIPVVIENRKGTYREGKDPDGKEWSVLMHGDYGYIPSTEAAGDKEGLDVFIGDDKASEYAYIVEQLWDGEFDEYKVVLGCSTLEAAEQLYLSNYEEGWEEAGHVGEISEVPLRHLFDAVKDNQEQVKQGSAEVIEHFLQQYERQRRLYAKAADVVREEITMACAQRGIRAAVTARAKSAESLRAKLLKRDALRPYAGVRDILNDIKDMAGVRVALYFPIDQDQMAEVIYSLYEQSRPPKHFPEDRELGEPADYEATHYAVKYAGLVVEIQVASALMYAYAEVSHDLIYKPRMGQLTPEEYQLLDELKAIVSAGEDTVTQLQEGLKSRTASLSPKAAQYLIAILAVRDRILRGSVN